MLYALTCVDNPENSHLRSKHREEHLQRIIAAQEAGHLYTAGPLFKDDNEQQHYGSLIIVDFDTIELAQAWADEEPFLKYGIYQSIIVTQYKKVF